MIFKNSNVVKQLNQVQQKEARGRWQIDNAHKFEVFSYFNPQTLRGLLVTWLKLHFEYATGTMPLNSNVS